MPHPIVVCPLRFEERVLRRGGLDRRAALVCCGPGPDAVAAWADRLAEVTQPVVLAGLAGGLSGRYTVGTAAAITEVRDGAGGSLRPTEQLTRPCVVTQAAAVVREPDERAALAAGGADLLDLESVAFAEAASARGWRWGIVRGVSDDAANPPPEGVESWINASGRTRLAPALAAVLRRPTLLPALARLRRNSTDALQAVGTLIEEMLASSS